MTDTSAHAFHPFMVTYTFQYKNLLFLIQDQCKI